MGTLVISASSTITRPDSGTTNLSLQTTAITNVNAVSATGTLGLDASLDTSTALTVTAGSGSDTFALNHSGTVSFSNFTEAHDSLQLDNSQFNLGTSGTLANSQFAEATSAHQMSATAQNYAENTSAGIIVINDVSGPGSSVWYTTNLENASTANSHEIAHLTINTSAIDHSAFHLAV